MLSLTLAFVAILCVAVVAHASVGVTERGVVARTIDSRAMLAAVFAATFLVLWYAWAARHPLPRVQDEMAYVLQAEIFARWRWALPSPPLPVFWEQPHVLVEPVLASKYFPGHSLVLTLGALIGWLPLMPLVLGACSGVLLFVLARRVASGAVAILAWTTWLFMPIVLYFGPSYFSESTTTFCWLAGWYALLQWRATRRTGWFVAVAVFTGWCAITRPLTAVAYAIPLAAVVLRDAVRGARWRQAAIAFAAGCVVIGILPLWSARTTGDWRVMPHTLYTRMYMPYDVPGFGFTSTPPSRHITPEVEQLNREYGSSHVRHTVTRLPVILGERAEYLSVGLWGSSVGILMVFALLGLLTLNATTALPVITSVSLVLTYLLYAHPASWTLYYFESSPAFAYVTAAGMAWAASLIGRPRGAANDATFNWRSPRWTRAVVTGSMVLILPGLVMLKTFRGQHIVDRRFLSRFAEQVGAVPATRAILFVRQSPEHSGHVTYVRNVADLANERIWVVYDRGDAENARLLALAPGRTAYFYDELVGRPAPYTPR